jgi:hypothetical protein
MDLFYKFCTPNQSAVAMRVKLVSFLENHQDLFRDLSDLAIEVNSYLKKYLSNDFSLHDLSMLLSHVFENNCRHDLKTKLTEHILKETDGIKISDGLNALAPVLVAMLEISNKLG